MSDDFSRELEEITKFFPNSPQGLSELRALIASLPAPSPLTLPDVQATKLPDTETQTDELSAGPVSTAGMAGGGASAPGSISGGSIIPGTLQAAAFASSIRPIQMIDGPDLPTLPDANFPVAAVIFNLDDGRTYYNDGGVWRTVAPERGPGNLISDPTFAAMGEGYAYYPPDWTQRGDWAHRQEAPYNPSNDSYLWLIYDRKSAYSPFSSGFVEICTPSDTAALDANAAIKPWSMLAKGDVIDLPYVVASCQVVDWGWSSGSESDFIDIDFSVEIWKSDPVPTKVAEQIVDVKTLPAYYPAQVWISWLRPDPDTDHDDYFPVFRVRVNKVATATHTTWYIGIGEPMLHFASTPDPAEFTPAIAKWTPDEVKAWEWGRSDTVSPTVWLFYNGIWFGSGATTEHDLQIARVAQRILRLGAFSTNTGLYIDEATQYELFLRVQRDDAQSSHPFGVKLQLDADTYERVGLRVSATDQEGTILLGPGSAAADVRARRTGTKALTIDDTGAGAITLDVIGRIRVGSVTVIERGTSFPGSPTTGDIYYRTDRNREYFYDGTRWLTTQEYAITGVILDTLQPHTTTGNTCYAAVDAGENGMFITRIVCATMVATTNDGTHNWTVQPQSRTGSGTTHNIGSSFSTSGDTAGVHTLHTTAPAALVTSGDVDLVLALTQNSSPGGFYCKALYFYRLVG